MGQKLAFGAACLALCIGAAAGSNDMTKPVRNASAETAAEPTAMGGDWNCTGGVPRVCGSAHKLAEPPRIIVREVPQPVPYPVVVSQPSPVYYPQPVYPSYRAYHHHPHRRF